MVEIELIERIRGVENILCIGIDGEVVLLSEQHEGCNWGHPNHDADVTLSNSKAHRRRDLVQTRCINAKDSAKLHLPRGLGGPNLNA